MGNITENCGTAPWGYSLLLIGPLRFQRTNNMKPKKPTFKPFAFLVPGTILRYNFGDVDFVVDCNYPELRWQICYSSHKFIIDRQKKVHKGSFTSPSFGQEMSFIKQLPELFYEPPNGLIMYNPFESE